MTHSEIANAMARGYGKFEEGAVSVYTLASLDPNRRRIERPYETAKPIVLEENPDGKGNC